ncbi:AAA family ATPase [Streptomyces sp. C36]|uniref:AAA family ATPase n=1 Tax=Streptomyces sp. C36 TaxID=3237122 RepID=UPI0034C63388
MPHRLLNEHGIKQQWPFTYLSAQTDISSGDWVRWYTHDEMPRRETAVAFSRMAHLPLEDHLLLLGLWEAAHEALEAQRRVDALPARIRFDEAAFVVTGPPGSGRSAALVNIRRALLAANTRVVLAAPKTSPLRELAGKDGVVSCFVQDDIGHDELEEALSSASPEEPVVVVMDNAEVLDKCEAGHLLKSLVQHGFEEGTALVAGCRDDKLPLGFGWLRETRKAHNGLLLSPQERSTGDVIGIRIGDSIVGWLIAPGQGWLHLGNGKLVAATVPG